MAHRAGSTALIIGGSIGGLLTATALRGAFDEVVPVECDDLPEQPGPRSGVPRGTQVHALLAIGARSMEQLLPGIVDQLIAAGGVPMDAGCDVAVFEAEGWAGRITSEAHVVSMRRTHLEQVLRRRVLELPNVTLRGGEVVGLTGDADRVTGVRLDGGGELAADLVVDSSGRGSRAPVWLAELGCARPQDQELRSYVGYATVPVRIPEGAFPDGVPAILSHPNPDNHYGSSVIPVDGGLHLFGALGMMKCCPPTEREAFLAHLDKASSPIVAELARKAEFVGDIVGHRMPGTRRRLWTGIDRPDGFAAVGDAVLSINPLYGQGMSVVGGGGRGGGGPGSGRAGRRARRPAGRAHPGRGGADRRAGVPAGPRHRRALPGGQVHRHRPHAAGDGRDGPGDGRAGLRGRRGQPGFRYAVQFFANEKLMSQSLVTKVLEWMGSGRSVADEHRDPTAIPGILGVAGPATIPDLVPPG